jgi:hypothetical protein
MLLTSPPYYTHSFGAMGEDIETAKKTGFFAWFHLEETERHAESPGEVLRFRPSGEKFRALCYLDALIAPAGQLIALELAVERTFLDGSDSLFAQDLVKSFLFAALPDACRSVLRDFLEEMNAPAGDGETPGYQVFRGRRSDWKTETGWSRLVMANLAPAGAPSLVVQLTANPTAPNSQLLREQQKD